MKWEDIGHVVIKTCKSDNEINRSTINFNATPKAVLLNVIILLKEEFTFLLYFIHLGMLKPEPLLNTATTENYKMCDISCLANCWVQNLKTVPLL